MHPPCSHIKSSILYISSLPTTVRTSNLAHLDPLTLLYLLHSLWASNEQPSFKRSGKRGGCFVRFTRRHAHLKALIKLIIIIIIIIITINIIVIIINGLTYGSLLLLMVDDSLAFAHPPWWWRSLTFPSPPSFNIDDAGASSLSSSSN